MKKVKKVGRPALKQKMVVKSFKMMPNDYEDLKAIADAMGTESKSLAIRELIRSKVLEGFIIGNPAK